MSAITEAMSLTPIPLELKKAVIRLHGSKCLACGVQTTGDFWSPTGLHYDHIIPEARGGLTILANLQPLCSRCNLRKGVQTIDYRPSAAIARHEEEKRRAAYRAKADYLHEALAMTRRMTHVERVVNELGRAPGHLVQKAETGLRWRDVLLGRPKTCVYSCACGWRPNEVSKDWAGAAEFALPHFEPLLPSRLGSGRGEWC